MPIDSINNAAQPKPVEQAEQASTDNEQRVQEQAQRQRVEQQQEAQREEERAEQSESERVAEAEAEARRQLENGENLDVSV